NGIFWVLRSGRRGAIRRRTSAHTPLATIASFAGDERALASGHDATAPEQYPSRRYRAETLAFGPYLCRARNLVERLGKLAANYLHSSSLHPYALWLRFNESTS